jgi:hypothetical protein
MPQRGLTPSTSGGGGGGGGSGGGVTKQSKSTCRGMTQKHFRKIEKQQENHMTNE